MAQEQGPKIDFAADTVEKALVTAEVAAMTLDRIATALEAIVLELQRRRTP